MVVERARHSQASEIALGVCCGVLVALGLLLLGEFAARNWIERHGDALDRAMAVLTVDSRLGWRQRKNFHGNFAGARVDTDGRGLRIPFEPTARPSGRKILLLGPSSSFGWGVEEGQTYARQLERRLRAMGDEVSVVNAGEIGYSSWQGLQLYRLFLRDVKPSLVILAYGVNDVDRYRFFMDGPDEDAVALGERVSGGIETVNSLAGKWMFLHLARRTAAALLARAACRIGIGGIPARQAVRGLRVPPEGFIDNMRAMAVLAEADGARVIVVTSGFRLARSREISPDRVHAAQELAQRALHEIDRGQTAAAARSFEEAVRLDSTRSEVYYQQWACETSLRHCAAARQAFETARQLEPGRIERDLRRYNALARNWAKREGRALLDVKELLKADEKNLYLDPIHPSAEGHRRIAEGLADLIRARRIL